MKGGKGNDEECKAAAIEDKNADTRRKTAATSKTATQQNQDTHADITH